MARELSVLVACGDDGDALRALVDRTQRTLARCGIDAEIVLVADGSHAVGPVVDDLAAAHANVVALHHDRRRGRLACWRSALAQSSGGTVCTLEPGAGHRPEAIAQLFRVQSAMRAEVVQGTRAPLASSRPALRWYLERALDRVVGAMLGLRGADVRSRFMLTTRDILADVLAHAERFDEAPGLLGAVAALRGYGIRQVETAYDVDALEPELDAVGALLRGAVALRRQPDTEMPLRGRLRRATASQLDELRRSQWLDGEALRALQRQRLDMLLRHAARHVEYYRARLERVGLGDDDATMLVDLAELPLLERATLAEDHGLTLVSASRDPTRVRRVVTAGARGELLEVFVDGAEGAVRDALDARHLEWAGLRAGGLHVRLSFGAPEHGRLVDGRLRLAARGRPVTLPIGAGDAADLDVALARLARLEPAVLEGSAEALILLAARGARLRGGAVVSHGQTLEVALRARLEQALGVPVFDRYGTRELGIVAQECAAHAGLHVNVETHVVEILRDGRAAADGEEGEIVVTALGNRVVPLLRYRIGDRATLLREPCACGRAAPRLASVRGREPSFVRAATGPSVPAGVLDELFRSQAAVVRRFQVEQQADGRVTIRVVRRPGFSAASEATLRHGLRAVLGDATPTDVVFVEWLAPDARAYLSHLAEGACPQLPLPL